MRLKGEVWAVILFTVVVSVTGRPEENVKSEKEISQLAERETRSFRQDNIRDGSEALTSSEVKTETKDDEITTTMINIEENSSMIKPNETTSNKTNTKLIERLSRSDEKSIQQKSYDTKNNLMNNNLNNVNNHPKDILLPEMKYYLPFNEPYDQRLEQNARVEFNPLNPQLNLNYEKLQTDIKNKYLNDLLSNYGNYLSQHIESKNMIPSSQGFNPQGFYNDMPGFNFNPTLKDIFNYNPVFDYIKKSDNQENFKNPDDENFESSKNSYVKRKIQHYQTVFRPNPFYFMNPQYQLSNQQIPQGQYEQQNQQLTTNQEQQQFPQNQQINQQVGIQQQEIKNNFIQENSNVNKFNQPLPIIPPIFPNSNNGFQKNQLQKIWDDYFPVVIQNPFNTMWTAFTNIVEYGPEADVCKKKKNKRRGRNVLKDDFEDDENEQDDDTRMVDAEDITPEFLFEDNLRNVPEIMPHIRRLKVRKGGVAIAGPGGIATAGSGGTAIVGPGGTAYTKQDGTAIVGPGGRLVHVPEFYSFPFFKQQDGDARTFKDPPGSKLIAMGPLVYYNVNPKD